MSVHGPTGGEGRCVFCVESPPGFPSPVSFPPEHQEGNQPLHGTEGLTGKTGHEDRPRMEDPGPGGRESQKIANAQTVVSQSTRDAD